MKRKILFGEISKPNASKEIPLSEAVGKTIQAVVSTMVDGRYGLEPCIELHLTDGTKIGFVLPCDD